MSASHSIRKAVVLAAGKGTRMAELTRTCPKPLLPVAGRPILHHVLERLGSAGVEDVALVIGETRGHLGQSALAAEAFGIEAGEAPPVDLAAERRHGEFLLAHRRLVRAATDLSDGGLALAAFELAEAAGIGLRLESGEIATLFGEDKARYLVACDPAEAEALLRAGEAEDVPVAQVGVFGGLAVQMGDDAGDLADLSQLYRGAFVARIFGAAGAAALP